MEQMTILTVWVYGEKGAKVFGGLKAEQMFSRAAALDCGAIVRFAADSCSAFVAQRIHLTACACRTRQGFPVLFTV